MNGDIYYRSRSVFCSFCKRTIEAFTTRAIAAKTFLCTATDRIVICVNYISLDSRGFLPTLLQRVILVSWKISLARPCARSRLRKPGNISIQANAYRVGSTNRPSLIRPLANYMAPDQCKSCVVVFFFFFFFFLTRDKKKRKRKRKTRELGSRNVVRF